MWSRLQCLNVKHRNKKAPRRALLFNADYDLVAIATHDPKEGQEVGEDVVDIQVNS
jgi:hypothetical protein